MPQPEVTVVIPTLAADSAFLDCLRALETQTFRDFDVIVVDNSGKGSARTFAPAAANVRFVENERNVGFGSAVNQGWRASRSSWIVALNDDAEPDAHWLEALMKAGADSGKIGMIASQVRLDDDHLDSAGMLIAADGSSKQRGHRQHPSHWSHAAPVLLPSGSAAAYRRVMLDDVGGFEESFFLYCEDTDLGLRAAWRGWKCAYAPNAVVRHRYSQSAGRASRMKAWYVERNRLRVVVRNFPLRRIAPALLASCARYLWHVIYLSKGSGTAAQFTQAGGSGLLLPWFVLKAHFDLLGSLPRLLQERRGIQRFTRISTDEFCQLLQQHRISIQQVASL